MSRRILIGCGSRSHPGWSRKAEGRREGVRECPLTFRLLLELMLETGIRVSDADFDSTRRLRTRVNRDCGLPIHATKKQANSAS